MIEFTRPPRGKPARVALAGLLGLGLILASVGPETLVSETTGSEYLGWLVSGILPFLIGAWLAPKVAYRKRDALIFLTIGPSAIPSAALFIKLIWRTAYLPHRDWPPVSERPAPIVPPAPPPASPPGPSWARDVTYG